MYTFGQINSDEWICLRKCMLFTFKDEILHYLLMINLFRRQNNVMFDVNVIEQRKKVFRKICIFRSLS